MLIKDVLKFIEDNSGDVNTMRSIRLAADKAVKSYNATLATVAPKQRYSDESMAIAKYLWTEISARYTFYKEANLEAWADDIDKLHRIDGFDFELINIVAVWSQDDSFWRQQVRSGSNLRRHFKSLLVKVKETEDNKVKIYRP